MTAEAPPPTMPTWAGINLQTAENLKFASTAQLFRTYLSSLSSPVSAPTLLAWLSNSYQGPLSPHGLPEGDGGSATLFGGLTYTGSFKHGLLDGHGTLSKPGAWSYTGSFSHNCVHGFGMYHWSNNAYYKGQVYQGLPHGDGLMFTGEPDSCTYEGAWKHGLRHGQGKLTYGKDCTTIYEGRWVLDHKHGDGHQLYDCGSTFKGSWLQGKRNGKGRFVSSSNGQPSSCPFRGELGRLKLTRIYVYEGDWMDDLSFGRGKSLWMNDEEDETSNHLFNYYKGEFDRGLRHGCGTFYYASGAMYMGGWAENKKNGDGCYIDANGKVLICKFVNDHPQQNEGDYLVRQIVQHGLGLAQINWLMRPTQYSWDSSFEIHKRSRQFVFREFVEAMLNICKVKFSTDECPLDEKLDRLATQHLVPVLSKDPAACSNVLMDVEAMKSVFDGYAPQLQKLFNETLRGVGTSDDTISLRTLDLFFQRYKPQWGLQRERLLFALIKGLYQSEIGVGDDGAMYVDNDINYMEFQVAIYLYAVNIKDQGAIVAPLIALNNLIKEAILPNLSTDLESLMNEDMIPNLPNINTKGGIGTLSSKTPRSVPGSKRSTPREGKAPQGAKSAPQTPLRKKT